MFGRACLRESLLWIIGLVLTMVVSLWLARDTPAGSPWRLLALAAVGAAVCAGLWVELHWAGARRRYT
jgi:hypothetical protein